jgi:hypothetical protein
MGKTDLCSVLEIYHNADLKSQFLQSIKAY